MRTKNLLHRLARATMIVATAVCTVPAAVNAATPASCYTCTPQCVPAARQWSGVDFPRVEYARDIPAAAKKAGFTVSAGPPIGRKSVGVIALGSVAHAIAITDAKVSGKVIKLVVSHANFDCKCSKETANATFSSGKINFTSGALKGRSIATLGFVSKPS